jgi:hypothetical protein
MNDDEHLDNILDEALSEYREAEPLAGLEDRVLQRLQSRPQERLAMRWKWGAVAACAALLAIMAWLGWRGHSTQTGAARVPVEARNTVVLPESRPTTQDARTVPADNSSHTRNDVRTRPAADAGPQLQASENKHRQALALRDPGSDLPSGPAPLTGEERQLIALAQANPDALRAITQEDQPITIAPLTIQPLLSEANQNGDN